MLRCGKGCRGPEARRLVPRLRSGSKPVKLEEIVLIGSNSTARYPASAAYARKVDCRITAPVPAGFSPSMAPGRQWENAEAEHDALDITSWRRKGIGYVFIDDQDSAANSDEIAHGGQGANRVSHVMHAFEGDGEVVLAGQGRVGRVLYFEMDAIGKSCSAASPWAARTERSSRSKPSTRTVG